MNRLMLLAGIVAGGAITASAMPTVPERGAGQACPVGAAQVAQAYLPFLENVGQVMDKNVRFVARTFAGAVYVTADGALVYALPGQRAEGGIRQTDNSALRQNRKDADNKPTDVAVVCEQWIGANQAIIQGGQRSAAKANFFFGRDPARWRSDTHAFESVEWRSIYSGIDLSVRAYGQNIEKVIALSPGAEPQDIVVNVAGAKALGLDANGRLAVRTALGEMYFTAPVAYQMGAQGRESVPVQYWVDGTRYGFELGDYDSARPLVIDPLLGGTFLGGYKWDDAFALTVDGQGRVYVAGYTISTDFPVTPGAYQIGLRGSDVFVSLFDNRLTNLVASTYLGGTEVQSAYAITLDPAGRVYVVGDTSSSNFPTTPNAYCRVHQSGATSDVFVAILDSGLSNLLASTFLVGDEMDTAYAITLDDATNIYVAGATRSTNYPTTGSAFQRTLKGWGDGFVSKLDNSLTQLLGSTYLGGSNYDRINSVKLDGVGGVFVTGITGGNGFPTTNFPYDNTFNGGELDGFVSKLDIYLSNLDSSTYIGGTGDDWPNVVIPGGSLIYIAGYTHSSNFPTIFGSYQTTFRGGTNDGFIAALDPTLNQLVGSTFLGGSDYDAIQDMVRLNDGTLWMTGYTHSPDFPTSLNAYCRTNRNNDAFVARMDGMLTTLGAATLVGGSWDDYGYAIGVDPQGNAFVAGYTESRDFPTSPGAYSQFYHEPSIPWYGDAFVIKMDPSLSASPAPPYYVTAGDKVYPDRILVSWAAAANAASYIVWRNTGLNLSTAVAITSFNDTVTAFFDWNVLPGTMYYYWVTAENAVGRSAFSDAAVGARSPVCPLAADFDGDRLADPTVVADGKWYIWMSGANYFRVGPAVGSAAMAMTAAGDFDHDGLADPAAVDVAGNWTVWFSAGGYSRVGPLALGVANASTLTADFDGDGLGDPTMVAGGTWYIWMSSVGFQPAIPLTYGSAEMIPLAADFDGDRYADFIRCLDGNWYIWCSTMFYERIGPLAYGEPGSLPVTADFDGDRRADPAAYKVGTGDWFVWFSSGGYFKGGPYSLHP